LRLSVCVRACVRACVCLCVCVSVQRCLPLFNVQTQSRRSRRIGRVSCDVFSLVCLRSV
jgi:hypothetical protein